MNSRCFQKVPVKIPLCWSIYPSISDGVEVLVSLSLEGSFMFLLTMVIMEEAKVENSKAEKEVSRLEDPVGEAPPTADESHYSV